MKSYFALPIRWWTWSTCYTIFCIPTCFVYEIITVGSSTTIEWTGICWTVGRARSQASNEISLFFNKTKNNVKLDSRLFDSQILAMNPIFLFFDYIRDNVKGIVLGLIFFLFLIQILASGQFFGEVKKGLNWPKKIFG